MVLLLKADKKEPSEVDYSYGKPNAHCGICRHFQPPHGCAKVNGAIDPHYWCELFNHVEAKKAHRHKPVYPFDVPHNVEQQKAYAAIMHTTLQKLQPVVVAQVSAALDKKRRAGKADYNERVRRLKERRGETGRYTDWERRADLFALGQHLRPVPLLLKQDEEDPDLNLADEVAQGLDLSTLSIAVDPVSRVGASVVGNSARIALAQFGWDRNSDIVDQVDPRAVTWAQQRAAELVGMRYNAQGKLVPSADATMRIDDPTRDMVRGIIYQGLQNGDRNTQIAAALEGVGPYPFSEDRANLIAMTEIARAHSQGSLTGYKAARDAGVSIKKEWSVNDDPCELCQANSDEGPIDLDDVFDSGDDAPPGHPNCECGIVPVVEEDDGGEKVAKGYNEDQPRDDHGRWSAGGGSGAKSAEIPSVAEQEQAIDGIKNYLGMVSGMQKPPAGWTSRQQFLLDHGQGFLVNKDTYAGPRGTQQQCYKNSAHLAVDYPDRYTYAEGVITVHGVPIDHAWVVDNKIGTVVDPTLRPGKNGYKDIDGYFGVKFGSNYLMQTMVRTKVYGLIGTHNRDLFKVPAPSFQKLAKDFNPDQPRDDDGRWTSGGGGEGAESSKSASDLYSKYADTSVTSSDILDKVPGSREAIASAQEKIASSVRTDAPVSEGGFKNPDGSWTADREALHQDIINGVLTDNAVERATPGYGEKPTVNLIGGRGGSGKSWLTSKDGPIDKSRSIVIDSDAIKAQLPEYQGWNAALLHEESSEIADHIMNTARDLGLNVTLDSTMRTGSGVMQRVAEFAASGYAVRGYYMFASPQEAATRATERFMRGSENGKTGRLVPPEYVLGSKTNEQSFDSVRGSMEYWAVYNGNERGVAPKPYAHGGKG